MSKDSIFNTIMKRRSVRRFEQKPVDRKLIFSCLEAARFAPSAENSQPWRFLIIDDPDVKSAFGEKIFSGIYRHTRWAINAPVLVVLLADLDFVTHRIAKVIQGIPFYLIDLGIAGEHFVLQAHSLGLGTCWIGWFHFKKARRFLKLPNNLKICDLIALGHPAKGWEAKQKKSKSIDEITRFNRW